MRKISTKSSEIKKKRRNNAIISIVLVLVLSLSIFGIVANSFGTSSSSEYKSYKGYSFYSQGDFWILEIQDFDFMFKYHPSELENFSAQTNQIKTLENYAGQPLYLSSEDSSSNYEISQNLNKIVSRIQFACLTEEDCSDELPVKNCTNNFIIIQKAEINNITQQENCVFIQGKTQDLTKLTDLFLYKVFGIKE